MELTQEHYRVAKIAYDAYVKQAGGVSLATGAKLPDFDSLTRAIKDAWAAAGIAVLLDGDRTRRDWQDTARLNRLEEEIRREPILLHNCESASDWPTHPRGLGLTPWSPRSLREALDRLAETAHA
jgi:hypothetical protein